MIVPPADRNTDPNFPGQPQLHDDTRFAAGKIAIFQYATVIIFLFLISGFWRLQIQSPEIYAEKAEQNRIKSRPLLAPRGRILDRDGRVIVANHVSSTLLLTRENMKPEDLKPIAEGLDLNLPDLQAKAARGGPKYRAIRLKEELSPADLAFVNSHRDVFPELDIISSQPRLYPQDGMMAHVIGYTGEVTQAELDSTDFAKYKQGDIVGQFGIERQYNDALTGTDGQQRVEVDNRGQVREEFKDGTIPAVAGKDLQLTIDLDLQAVAEIAMDGKNGAVVALDPRNGEILAMVSRPTFDPNKFVGHIKASDWNAINANPDHPLMNRAIQAQFAPGSTFKPVVALAALETGTIDENTPVHCPGYVVLYGHTYHCWEKKGHGTVSLHNGIVHSCDVYFYTVGSRMGIDDLALYAKMVGFGQPTGVDLPGEVSGGVPSPEEVLHTYHRKWYAGETPSVAIGQGDLKVTPIQLARAIGGIAMGGVWHVPHLVKNDAIAAKTTIWPVDPKHVQDVVDGMWGCINEAGTGAQSVIPGLDFCGKTGSAQLASVDVAKAAAANHETGLKDNAWFVGFAPRRNPEIVVVALFEHGVHGNLAGPIVRDVVKAYFDKKTRIQTWLQQKTAVTAGLAKVSTLDLPQPAHN
ncbi:MAG TPA: penicillin-binding protein 2 [Bryobacteraceae bacterium]|nr:penicillin-binding protein 2 [Bryobacteraceae bacterium]